MNPPPPPHTYLKVWLGNYSLNIFFGFCHYLMVNLGGGGRYSGFQVGIIEWGQKPKPNKIPRASNKTRKKSLDQTLTPKNLYNEFPSLKHFQKALKNKEINVCICLFITPFEVICYECSVCLEYPKKIHQNYQATEKNTCQNFLPKKSPNKKFQTQNNPSIIPVTSNLEYTLWNSKISLKLLKTTIFKKLRYWRK